MAIKNSLNLNQLHTLGGSLTDEELKKQAEEKRRAQIRALDELEAEAGVSSGGSLPAPSGLKKQSSDSSSLYSSVGQLGVGKQNTLGISGEVINDSVATRKNVVIKNTGSSVQSIFDKLDQYNNRKNLTQQSKNSTQQNGSGAEVTSPITTEYGTTTTNMGNRLLDNLERIERSKSLEELRESGNLNKKSAAELEAQLTSKNKAMREGIKGIEITGEAAAGGIGRGIGEIVDAVAASPIGWGIDSAEKAVNGESADSYGKYADDYLLSGETNMDVSAQRLQKLREKYPEVNSGAAKLAFDTVENTTRQVPRLLISAIPVVGKALASVTMFGTSAASAYKEARENNASVDTARMYAVLSGAIEAGGEELIGGVLGQGVGALDKYIFKVADKISSPVFKTAAKLGLSTLGEGAEEMIQSVLSTWAQRATYDPDAEIDFTEVAYEGLIGALSAGLMTAANPSGVIAKYNESYGEIALNNAKKELRFRTSDEVVGMIDDVHAVAVELGQEQQFKDALLAVYEKNYDLENKKTVKEKLTGLLPSKTDPDAEMYKSFTDVFTDNISEESKKAVAEAAAKYDVGTAETRESGDLFEVSEEKIAEGERLSKISGSKVVFFEDTDSGFNGYYENGTIYINKNAKNPLAVVLSHELTHSLEGTDAYDDLSYFVFNSLINSDSNIGQMIEDKIDGYALRGVELDEDGARREIVADYISENFMGSEAQIQSVVAKDRSLALKIREFFDRVLAKLGNEGAKTRVEEYNRIKEIRDLYKKALGERVESEDGRDTEHSLYETKTPSYDELVDKPDMKVIDVREDVADYKSQKNDFNASEEKLAMTQQPYINADTGEPIFITNNTFTHSFSNSGEQLWVLKHLPEIIENAVLTHREKSRKAPRDHTTGVYTFFAAVRMNDGIHPVKLKVKEYYNEGQSTNSSIESWIKSYNDITYSTAYDSRALELEEIKIEDTSSSAASDLSVDNYPSASSEIRISDLLDLVNSEYQKYIPSRQYSLSENNSENAQNNTDNVRVNAETGELLLLAKPTADEERFIRSYLYESRGAGTIYMTDGNGKTVKLSVPASRYASYSISNVIDKIRSYYRENNAQNQVQNNEHEVRDEDILYERGVSDEDTAAELYRDEAMKNASDKIRNEILSSRANIQAGKRTDNTFSDSDLELLEAMKADQESWLESDPEDVDSLGYYSSNRQNFNGKSTEAAEWSKQREAFNEIVAEAYPNNTGEQQRVAEDFLSGTIAKISSGEIKERRTIKSRIEDAKASVESAVSSVMRKMVDAGYTVGKLSKSANAPSLYYSFNAARSSSNAAIYMINEKQTDVAGNVVGDGLNKILTPIREKGEAYYKEFQAYLLHLHNQDRMSRQNSERTMKAREAFSEFVKEHPELKNYAEYQLESMRWTNDDVNEYFQLRDAMRKEELKINKPVFGFEVTAEDSANAAAELIKEHPEFEEYKEQIYKYRDNLMQYRVESGLLSADEAAYIQAVYPHYVPVYRAGDFKAKEGHDVKNATVGKTVKRAVGGDTAILPLHTALAKQTMSVVREASKNMFGEKLVSLYQSEDGYAAVKQHIKEIQQTDYSVSEDTFDAFDDPAPRRENTFTVRYNGKAYDLTISPDLFEAVRSLAPSEESNNIVVKQARSLNTLYKSLITGYNPLFLVRNAMKDIQDVAINSKDLSEFLKAYPLAWKEITTNGDWWQKYKAAGGLYSSVFDYSTGESKGHSGIGKVADAIETANMVIEQVPRLAEFIATMKNGDGSHENMMEALYNANEVTTNFGRSGTWGKFLNSNFVPFLNPSIQGFDKVIRNITETKGAKNWIRLAGKAAILGVAPRLLNELLCGGEDDWDEIQERVKDTFYLFPVGDGKWIKIPKGRTIAVVGTFSDAIYDMAAEGETDLWGKLETAVTQIGPTNPLEENILKAWMDADLFNAESPGRTWYGTNIESERLQGYAPGERYDEKTDVISKWLGEKTGLSPKKISYLLDQYSGVIGDAILPLLTPTSSDGMFKNAFTTDTVYSNNLSEEFYSLLDELEFAKNSESATGSDTAAYRYMYNRMLDASEINKQIREIEASDASNSEKQEETRALYYVRNAIMRDAIDNYGDWREAENDYYEAEINRGKDDSSASEYAYNEANREIFGAESALESMGKSIYEGAQDAAAETGISYDDYYEWYTKVKVKNGKLSEQIDAITNSDLSSKAKMQIYYNKYATVKERDVIDMLQQDGTPDSEIYETLSKIHLAGTSYEKRSVLYTSNLTPYEQSTYYFTALASDSQKSKLAELIDGGISQVEYYYFLMNTLDVEGENRKEQITEYIDSTGMTDDEKDLLYIAAGYSESTLSKTPWHSGGLFSNSGGLFSGGSLFGDGEGLFNYSGGLFGDGGGLFG